MPYDPIKGQGQGHRGVKCVKIAITSANVHVIKQESRAVAGNPRDAAVIFDP